MSSDLPLVIVNPTSAAGRTGARWAAAASDLRAHFGAFRVEFTSAPGDARRLAREAAEADRKFIIACGGDGTIHEVANGILESRRDAELGILPSGTGGDFRRTLGFPARAADAAQALRDGRTARIDVGRVTYTNRAGAAESRYFVGVASAGAGGKVIERVKADDASSSALSRLLGGRAAFALATLRTTMEFEPPLVSVQLDDGEARPLRTLNFCVCNARYFGGGMMIAPDARLDDGLLDVVALGDLDRLTILKRSHTLYRGTHLAAGIGMVHHRRARVVRLLPEDTRAVVLVEADGEVVGCLPATFEIAPGALLLRRPA